MYPYWRGEERRSQKRYPCCGSVRILAPGTPICTLGTIEDISLSGCALRLRSQTCINSDIPVELNFTTSYFTFRAVGSIRRIEDEGTLARIAFVELNNRGRSDIQAFIRDQAEEQRLSALSNLSAQYAHS